MGSNCQWWLLMVLMKKLCWALLLVLFRISFVSGTYFEVNNCSSSNYNTSSDIQSIREVTSALINASNSSLFHNTSFSSSTTTTYGMYQCRADLAFAPCSACVNMSLVVATQQICPSSVAAHISMENCHVRYDNLPGLFDGTSPDMSVWVYVWNPLQSLNATYQNDILKVSLRVMALAPTQPNFAAYSKEGSFYALAQCDSYLSESQCSTCLGSIPEAATYMNRSNSGKIFFGSCIYRYEEYAFYSSLPLSPSSSSTGAITGGVIGSVLFVGLIACLLLFYYWRKKKSQGLYQDLNPFHPSATIYSYDELRTATQDFHPHNKLGQGGFGPVYKGILANGQEVAIKKLSIGSHQGKKEFMNEVTMITSVQHRNLIKLFGCCIEGPERLLVYEYLPKKSLDMFIFDSKDGNHTNIMLDWQTRVEIIKGIARGLAYLHEDSQVHIIHRDIKPGNILLDNDFTPKIADFGLARLSNNDANHMTTTIMGTIGYLSPEYAMHGQLTEKADVFSFGVVVLEIVSGRRNTDYTQPEEKQHLLEWAWKCYREGGQLQLLDPQLINMITPLEEEELAHVIHVAILCIQSLAIDRPLMSKVGQILVGKHENLDVPNNNPFSITTTMDHLRTIMDTASTIPSTQHSSHTASSVSTQFFNVIPR